MTTRDNTGRNAKIKDRKKKKMQKKVLELGKRYPANKYEIQEAPNKEGRLLTFIRRITGIKPHKKSKKGQK